MVFLARNAGASTLARRRRISEAMDNTALDQLDQRGGGLTYRGVRLALLLLLSVSAFLILRPFVVPIIWGAIIVIATWPANAALRSRFRRFPEALAALLLTFLLVGGMALILLPISIEIGGEVRRSTAYLRDYTQPGSESMEYLAEKASVLPLVGPRLESMLSGETAIQRQVLSLAARYQTLMVDVLSSAARGMGSLLFHLIVTLFCCYFLYRHGDRLGAQIQRAAFKLGGEGFVGLVRTAADTTIGVMHGLVLTALVQGVLAGVGFSVAGAPVPALLGLATLVLSLIPFGPPLLYLPVSLYLYLQGQPWYVASGLALWGVLVVSMADNLLRPLFISQTTRMPVLLAVFGVIGGLLQLGLVGVFIGPVVLALAQTVWLAFASAPRLESEPAS